MSDVHINGVLKELKEKLRTLEAEIEIKAELAKGYREVIADMEAAGHMISARVPKELRNSILQVLREEAAPLHYKDIYERLKARGLKVGGKEPARNVIAHMSQDDRFKNVGPGMWGLTSMQPRGHNSPQFGG